MKKIYAILLSMGVLSAVSSCDYLDVVPDNIATIEIAFNNRSTALNYLSTLYWYIPETGKIGSDPGMDVGDEIWYYGDRSTDFTNTTTFWIAMGRQNTGNPIELWQTAFQRTAELQYFPRKHLGGKKYDRAGKKPVGRRSESHQGLSALLPYAALWSNSDDERKYSRNSR